MNWHRRYLQQAGWTGELRTYLFEQAHLPTARRVIEVGCGTGAVLRDLAIHDPQLSAQDQTPRRLTYGLDLDADSLTQCRRHAPTALLTRADALALPYSDQAFDITCCHFLLLWTLEPLAALREMKRVTRQRGYVLALAEPDYTARLDRPRTLADLGKFQNESLRRQGANVALGAHLADLFERAGINITQTGTIQPGRQSKRGPDPEDLEWQVLRADVTGILSTEELGRLEHLEAEARRRGERVLYVPTHFAFGQV